mgnify:CR=1 FL=1
MPLELNKEQQAAADFLNGICVVVAVPGSGKTLTMTHRIGIVGVGSSVGKKKKGPQTEIYNPLI